LPAARFVLDPAAFGGRPAAAERIPMFPRPLALAFIGAAMLAAPSAFAQTAPADDPVVARVNGKELHRSDVEAAQKSLPAQAQQMPMEQLYPLLLDQMVNGMIVADAGRKDKLDQDPALKKRLARYEDRLVQEAYLNKMVEAAATTDKLQERYQQYVKDNPPKEEVSARHILVDKEDEAKAIIKDLDKGGDFAELAKKHSKDPGAKNGGDLGFFSAGEMVPEFSEAAFKLKKGEYTKTPVKTQFGWHIIKVEDRRMAAPPSFDETKDELQNQMARDVITQRIAELRKDAKVETFAIDGSPMPPAPAKQ
jgi:peptidyl-prolyl cis-trans isomerase C